MNRNRLSRRDFLRASALTAVGIAAASCAQPTPQIIEKQVPVEKIVKETVVVQKEVAVEKVVTATPVAMKYKEAPMLAGLVQSGQLPPVDERLPEQPMIITPREEIGQYGGTWHRLAVSAGDIQITGRLSYENLVRFDINGAEVVPNICPSWQISPDGKVFTFKLRKGMKWSDGHPFTADDIMFYLNDHMGNKELTTTLPGWLTPGKQPYTAEKVDDYTWKITFGAPGGLFMLMLASNYGMSFSNFPRHFCEQYHVGYVDKATLEKKAKDAGFEFWYQLYNNRRAQGASGTGEVPVIFAWMITVPAPKQPVVAERNPYYWKVDTEGNQLPYIDRIEHMIVQDAAQVNLRAVAGEVDMQFRHMTFDNYPLFQENKDKGGYRILQWQRGYITDSMLQPSICAKDPVLRKVMEDKRFRYALSLGIKRQEIIDAVFLGITEPTQICPLPSSPYYWEEQAKNMLEYDPVQANKYLDELGLTQKDSEGYRLRPDGKRLAPTFEYAPNFGAWRSIAELLRAQWRDLGVDLVVKEVSRDLWNEHRVANDLEITMWTSNAEFNPLVDPRTLINFQGGRLFEMWRDSGGKEGEEPPEWMKKQYELYDTIAVTIDPEEQKKMMRQILEIHKEQMVTIGICTAPPEVVVVKNNFRNVPEKAISDWPLLSPGNTTVEQYFIKPS